MISGEQTNVVSPPFFSKRLNDICYFKSNDNLYSVQGRFWSENIAQKVLNFFRFLETFRRAGKLGGNVSNGDIKCM